MQLININTGQCRMARAVLRMKVRELAQLAGISPTTITTWESGRSRPTWETLARIKQVLEAKGIVFVDDGDMTGILVKRPPA